MKRYLALFLALSILFLSGCGGRKNEVQAQPLRQEVEIQQKEVVTLEMIRTATFADIPQESIWRDVAGYIGYHGIMNGTGDNMFSPNAMVNRAMVAKVLYEMGRKEEAAAELPAASGQEAPASSPRFSDVPAESWYAEAVAWCDENGVMNGVSEQEFSPMTPVTRAQLALILYRVAREAGAVVEVAVETPGEAAEGEVKVTADDLTVAEGNDPAQTDAALSTVQGGEESVANAPASSEAGQGEEAAPESAPGGEGLVETVTGIDACRDGEKVPQYAREAMEWALREDIYRPMIADTIEPNIAVSRIQLAQALVALLAMTEEDELAEQIHAALPARQSLSAARDNHDAIQAAVDAAGQKYGAAGVQVAVIEKGVVTDTYAYGWATTGVDPMTAEHKMRIASLSKIAVGLTAMALKEEGKVDLDTSIGDYWGMTVQNPAYPDTPISIRSVLSHTSSIINAGDDVSRSYDAVRAKLQTNGGYSHHTPGNIGYWSYNNYAFGVLGMTLELAAGKVVDDVMTENFYTAMDIDAAFAGGDLRDTTHLVTLSRAGQVTRSVAAQQNMHTNPVPGATGTYFAGGLVVSAADFAKLIAMLANNGSYEGVELLKEETVALMETCDPQPTPDGSLQALPMRYRSGVYGREGVYFHTGSAYGVYNCATYDPLTGDGVVVLSVGASGAKDASGIYAVCSEINNVIYGVIQ